MSLFKERERSAKKIISLQNIIHKLEAQLKEASSSSDYETQLATQAKELATSVELVEAQKAELKKLKSENTRLKNKIAKLEQPKDTEES
tara:strand:+ start:408 stop:674 length:267 start_codon:yes stop_codon:yes gene_type:complete